MTVLVLASASPARRATLIAAGITPEVQVSGVDEPAVLADAVARYGEIDPADTVLVLARAKALDVAAQREGDEIVLGCDSMLEFDGTVVGKPADATEATERWRRMRGKTGVLHTGHWLVDVRDLAMDGGTGTGGTVGATSSTTVHFADLSDEEITAYVATGEPLAVAGAFTVDGIGGPFVTAIDGDYHGVVGVSLPLLRELLAELGVPIHTLWSTGEQTASPTETPPAL